MPRSLRVVMLSVLLAGHALAGCSGKSDPPAHAPVPAPPSSLAQVDDPPGTITCGKAVRAVRDATLMAPGVVTDIVNTSGTADAPVADAAQRLSTAYTKAVAAHGTVDEPDAVAAVSAAAAEMVSICGDSGLETVG